MSKLVNQYINEMANCMEMRGRQPSFDVWPAPSANITLANDITAEYLIDYLNKLFDKNSIERMASLFEFPSKLSTYMYLFITSPKDNEDAAMRTVLADKMLQTIKFLRNSNPFLNNSNKIGNTEKDFYHFKLYSIENPNCVMLIRKINAALSIINEYNFMAWTALGKEFHGNYKGEQGNYFIRDFFDLKVDYWKFSETIPWKKIKIITDERVDAQFDFVGRMYTKNLLLNDLNCCTLILDKEIIDPNEKLLGEIFDILLRATKIAKSEANDLTGNELLVKYAYGQLRGLTTIKGDFQDNQILDYPNSIISKLKSINGKSSFEKVGQIISTAKTKLQRIALFKKILDPGEVNKELI